MLALEADDIVHECRLRLPGRHVVTLGHGGRDFFVAAAGDFRHGIAAVSHERFVHPTGGRAGVQRHIIDPKSISM